MKKVLLVLCTVLLLVSCNENGMARKWGGVVEIDVEPGYKVTSATWKETDIFYFIEPMEEDYTPKTKRFVESSGYGIIECTVIFNESKK